MKRALAGGLFAAATLFGGLALTSTPVAAEVEEKPGQEVCPDLQSGKLPLSNTTTFEIEADEGFLISEYCVKAGSDTSVDDGAVNYVDLRPDKLAASVVITGPGGKNISHYSYSQVKKPEETTTTAATTTTTTMAATTLPPQIAPPSAGQVASQSPVAPAAVAPTAAAPTAAAPTQLPSTGNSSWVTALIALAALAGGTGLVRLSRRQTD